MQRPLCKLILTRPGGGRRAGAELMELVNAWLIRTGVTVINVESIYYHGPAGIAVKNGFMGVRVWVLYEARES